MRRSQCRTLPAAPVGNPAKQRGQKAVLATRHRPGILDRGSPQVTIAFPCPAVSLCGVDTIRRHCAPGGAPVGDSSHVAAGIRAGKSAVSAPESTAISWFPDLDSSLRESSWHCEAIGVERDERCWRSASQRFCQRPMVERSTARSGSASGGGGVALWSLRSRRYAEQDHKAASQYRRL